MTRHAAGLVLGFVAALTMVSTAEAAKGTKKNNQTTVHGQVVGLHGIGMQNGTAGAALTIKVPHHKKTGAALAGGAGSHQSQRTFHLTAATRFERLVGTQLQPANIAAVHLGSHVLVHAQGNQAEKVVVTGQSGRMGAAAGTLAKRRAKPNQTTHKGARNGTHNGAHHGAPNGARNGANNGMLKARRA